MRQSLILEAALGYAELGIAVLPMRSGKKTPLTRHGSLDASRDPAEINRWWRRWPEAEPALACGAISGFDALDVDRQHGGIEALAGLIDRHGPLPDTSRQQTPSGGFHLLFRHQPGLKNRSGGQGNVPHGLDCRTSGAMIKAAPAAGYRWTRFLDPATLPPWPDWLAAFYLDANEDLLAASVALSLKERSIDQGRVPTLLDQIGIVLGGNTVVSSRWRPTTANFWGRIPMRSALAIGKEVLGDAWAERHARDKKAVLGQALETAFASGTEPVDGVTPEARARAASWLPPGMGVQEDPPADADEIGVSAAVASANAERAAPA